MGTKAISSKGAKPPAGQPANRSIAETITAENNGKRPGPENGVIRQKY